MNVPCRSNKQLLEFQNGKKNKEITVKEVIKENFTELKGLEFWIERTHQEESGRHTSLLDSLIRQRTDSRSKNYNPAACGMKTTFTER